MLSRESVPAVQAYRAPDGRLSGGRIHRLEVISAATHNRASDLSGAPDHITGATHLHVHRLVCATGLQPGR